MPTNRPIPPAAEQADKRAILWPLIRATGRRGQPITVAALRNATGGRRMAPTTVRGYLLALTAGGVLTPEGVGVWRLNADPGPEVPRLNRAGRPTAGARPDRLWAVMPILKDFSARDLAVNTNTAGLEITERYCAGYCRALERAGILHGTPATLHSPRRWTLITSRRTGPLAPVPRGDGTVYDPNTGATVGRGGDRA